MNVFKLSSQVINRFFTLIAMAALVTVISGCNTLMAQPKLTKIFVGDGPLPESTPPGLIVKPDISSHDWMLREDMVWEIGNTGVTITVPAGFVTDLASSPRLVWPFGLSPIEQYTRAAIIHDYLYWTQVCSRAQADNLLLIAMKESEVTEWQMNAVYTAVNLKGESAWEINKTQRKNGLPKIIPTEWRDQPAKVKWVEVEKKMMANGVRDPEVQMNPAFCKYGDSKNVPFDPSRPPTPDEHRVKIPTSALQQFPK